MDTHEELDEIQEETPDVVEDFAQLDVKAPSEQGATLHLENPFTGKKLFLKDGRPQTITVLGPDSAKMRAYSRKLIDRHVEAHRKGKATTTEMTEREKFEGLALVTLRWTLPPIDGKDLVCNEANARRFYSDPRFPFVAEQLNDFIGDRQRFFTKASTD